MSVNKLTVSKKVVIPAPCQVQDKLQPESRVPGENPDPAFEMVPDFRRDDVWMPDQVRHDGKRCLWAGSIYRPPIPYPGKQSSP